jgi:hypothetical protein
MDAPVSPSAQRRARERLDDPSAVSDAGPEVAAALTAAFEPLDDVPADRHLTVRGDLPPHAALDAVEASVDAGHGDRPLPAR